MELKLAENIKALRKARNMTQEQLAEALGVTVGAVYKWERRLSTPDISLILELADLFGTSTDVLLGYRWRSGGAGAALEQIKTLTAEHQYAEAAAEAEKALKKYPNCFALVYESAELYLSKGEADKERRAYLRSIELYSHACGLIEQNIDDSISEVSIQAKIARAELWLGRTDAALERLKKYNVCGVNNAFIGMILADFLHETVEAEQYLGLAVGSALEDLDSAMIGYANVCFRRGAYDAAADCIRWLRNMLRGIQPPEELTWFDKYDCILLEIMAEICCFQNDPASARQYLRQALEKAKRYDLAAPAGICGVRLYEMLRINYQPTYEIYDKTALGCLKRRIQDDGRKESEDDVIPYLLELWREELKEVFPDEAV